MGKRSLDPAQIWMPDGPVSMSGPRVFLFCINYVAQ